MFDHATLPKLPERLWQAAFFMDMVRQDPNTTFGPEVMAMSERLSRQAD
jgi:hypothetical protein